jgi:hypothetical protein
MSSAPPSIFDIRRGQSGVNINTNQSHIFQPNAREYSYYRQYVSIHSEDRNKDKYPNSNAFSISLPQTYTNISSIRLSSWSFPSNYDVFSLKNNNTTLQFQITAPSSYGIEDENSYDFYIYNYLLDTSNIIHIATIENGFYNPLQIATEVMNQLNKTITFAVYDYIIICEQSGTAPAGTASNFINNGGYTRFKVAYHDVNHHVYIGNQGDQFQLSSTKLSECLGFNNIIQSIPSNGETLRFRYGDAMTSGDDGYWITHLGDTYYDTSYSVYFVVAPKKINIMGQAYMYMELDGLNAIDETDPYVSSKTTKKFNEGETSRHNSAIAKLAIPTAPLSQFFDRESIPYKTFVPPKENLSKISVKLRLHDGTLMEFEDFDYSFMLEITQFIPTPKMDLYISQRG